MIRRSFACILLSSPQIVQVECSAWGNAIGIVTATAEPPPFFRKDKPVHTITDTYMQHLLSLFLLMLLCVPHLSAEKYTDLAQKTLEWLQTETGDSILAHCSPKMKEQMRTVPLNSLWAQLQLQAGNFKQQRPWQATQYADHEVRQSVLEFERANLRLNVVLNKELQLEGLTITPVPVETRPDASASSPAMPDTSAVTERSVTIKHHHISLGGTLSLPSGYTGKLPAVVLVQGSGPSDRDETIGPNKPFRELAHGLAAQGIAVLRYDKRTHVYAQDMATLTAEPMTYMTECVYDAAQALKQLSEMPEVDPQRVFVLGHSLGGTVLPLIVEHAATRPAGIVGVAAMSLPFWDNVHRQLTYVMMQTTQQDSLTCDSLVSETVAQMRKSLPQEYLDFQQQYDATREVQKLGDISCLFIQGGHDYQVTIGDFNLWKEALKGNSHASFLYYPMLDHLMRPLSQMAVPQDYLREIPMSKEVIQSVASFIKGTPATTH